MNESVVPQSAPREEGQVFLARLRVALIGRFGVFGKDLFVHLRSLGIFLFVLISVNLMTDLGRYFFGGSIPSPEYRPAVLYWLWVFFAYTVGLALGAEEDSTDPRVFLNRLPMSGARVYRQKLSVLIVMVVAFFLVGGVVASLLALQPPHYFAKMVIGIFERAEIALFALMTVTIGVCGIYFGGRFRRALPIGAMAGAIAIGGVIWILMTLMVTWSRSEFVSPVQVATHEGDDLLLFAFAIVGIAGLVAGFHHFVTFDEDSDGGGIAVPRFPSFSLRTNISVPSLVNRSVLQGAVAGLPFALIAAYAASQTTGGVAGDQGFVLVFSALAGAFLGVISLPAPERDATFFLYALPVSRGRFLLRRVVSIVLAALALAGIVLGALLLTADTRQGDSGVVLLLLTIVSSALIGHFTRLFLSSIVTALLLASLYCGWLIPVVLFAWASGSPYGVVPSIPEALVVLAWPWIVLVGLPLGMLFLAYTCSTVFEASESRRGSVYMAIFFASIVWLPTLLLASPIDIIRVIFG